MTCQFKAEKWGIDYIKWFILQALPRTHLEFPIILDGGRGNSVCYCIQNAASKSALQLFEMQHFIATKHCGLCRFILPCESEGSESWQSDLRASKFSTLQRYKKLTPRSCMGQNQFETQESSPPHPDIYPSKSTSSIPTWWDRGDSVVGIRYRNDIYPAIFGRSNGFRKGTGVLLPWLVLDSLEVEHWSFGHRYIV